jgi:hypothetical protein
VMRRKRTGKTNNLHGLKKLFIIVPKCSCFVGS